MSAHYIEVIGPPSEQADGREAMTVALHGARVDYCWREWWNSDMAVYVIEVRGTPGKQTDAMEDTIVALDDVGVDFTWKPLDRWMRNRLRKRGLTPAR
jgi:hypothetical protein